VRLSTRHLIAAGLVAIAAGAVFGAIAGTMFLTSGDFKFHLDIAKRFSESGRPAVPHFLFHGATAVVYAVLPGASLAAAGTLVMAAAYFLTGGVAYAMFWRRLRESRLAAPLWLAVATLATLIAQPITMAPGYTLGYLWPEPYTSPTYSMMKPFALAGFAATAWFLARRRAPSVGIVLLFALVSIASGLSKPNFIICLLPAAALLTTYRIWRRQPVSTAALVVGLFVPAAAIVAWQIFASFAVGGDADAAMYQDSVSWAPLKFMRHWATGLTAKFVASTLFPLTVTAAYWPQARRDTLLQCGWLCFGFGAFYSYALAETRNFHTGNFVWSGYITVFTLFVAAAVVWLREAAAAEGKWPVGRALVCGAGFALHVASGARLTWQYLSAP